MLTNSSCTVYKFNGIGYDKYYISACHWQENKASNVLKSGLQNADGITVYIPLDCIMISPCEIVPASYLLPSISNAPYSATKDIIVKDKCDYIFNNTSQQNVSQSFKEFSNKYDYHTVMSIDNNLYGSKHMQHIKVSAR